ncbi:TonB-dependent receptor plug domain-containing protein [Acidihalobacter prosperus]
MRLQYVLIGSAIAACAVAQSVTYADSNPPVLVITPTRFEQSSGETVKPTRVITHRQIKASGASTVAGVLQFYPGFGVVASGGPGQLTSVFLQGTNSNMAKVLINGVPVNDSTTGAAPWADIPAADIERIEVVKGPLSTLWGSGAMGGVINIITLKPSGLGGRVAGSWGGWGTRKGLLGVHASGHQLSAGATVSANHTAGFPPVKGMQQPAPYSNRTVIADAGWRGRHADLQANLWQSRGRVAYATGYPPYSPLTLLSQRYLHQTAGLHFGVSLLPHWRLKGGILQTRNSLNQDQPDITDTGTYDFARSIRNQDLAELTYAAGATQLLMGGSQALTHAASLSYGSAYNDYRRTHAVYGEWQQHAGKWRFTVAVRRTHDSQFGIHDTWNLGVGYRLNASTVLDVSAGTGYRAPTFNDLYGYGGNQQLKPELSHSIQAEIHAGMGSLGQVHFTAFDQRINDLIETVLVNPSTAQYKNRNVAQARIRGVTLGWSWLMSGLSLEMDATWQKPINLNTGEYLLRRASHRYHARINYVFGRWRLGNNWVYTGKRPDFGGQTLSPYLLGNLTLSVRIDRSWRVRASVDNLLNTGYVPAYYDGNLAYVAPARSGKIGFRYKFGTF